MLNEHDVDTLDGQDIPLAQKVVRAGFWAFALSLTRQVLVLIRAFVLALLLMPKDFGLFSMALITLALLETFSTLGFNQALIQKKEDITSYLDTAWTVTLVRALLLAIFVYIIAPSVAAFFGEPAVTALARAMSISLVLRGLSNIGVITFRRKLDFRKVFFLGFSFVFTDMLVATIAAFFFRNAWALVLGNLAGTLMLAVVSYLIHPHRPRLRCEVAKFKELFQFGVWMFLHGITLFVGAQGANLVIGKAIGAIALGYFQMAGKISGTVLSSLSSTISQVAFPAYSNLHGSSQRVREAYLRISGFSMALIAPASLGIILLGYDFTRMFLGAKWLPMVPALLILSVSALFTSITSTGKTAFMGIGQPKISFHVQAAKSATIFILIYPLSARWGITGASIAAVISSVFAFAVWFHNVRTKIGVSPRDMIHVFIPPLISAVLMAGALLGVRTLTLSFFWGGRLFKFIWLFSMVLAGVVLYLSFLYIFHLFSSKIHPFKEIIKTFKSTVFKQQ